MKRLWAVLLLVYLVGCESNNSSSVSNTGPNNSPSQNKSADEFKVPLGNPTGLGLYMMPLLIGGKTYQMQVDTGSSNTLLLGSSSICSSCASSPYYVATDGVYEPTANSTLIAGGQSFNITYGIGYGDFLLYNEQVSLPKGTPFTYPVGVFKQGESISNIVGLGYSINTAGPDEYGSFWDALREHNKLPNVFSLNLCVDNNPHSYIDFGQYDNSLPIQWTAINPLQTTNGDLFIHYVVQPVSLTTAGKTIAFPTQQNGYATIADTGSSLLMLTKDMINQIADAYPQVSPDFWDADVLNTAAGDTVMALTQLGFAMLKPIEISLPDENQNLFKVSIPPEDYTMKVPDPTTGETLYVSNISSVPERVGNRFGFLILGDVFLMNHYVVYDNAGKRLGIADNKKLCS